LTFEPERSFVPAFGFCEMTFPFGTVFDFAFVTVPVLQWPAAIFRFAVASGLPFTFGTTQETTVFGFWSNVAVTVLAASTVTVQLPLPLQAPLQPANVEPASGLAARVTLVPESKSAAHVVPQLIPPEPLVTVPLPVPDFVTDSVNFVAPAVTVSTTCGAAL
jgi:hypothetical protein